MGSGSRPVGSGRRRCAHHYRNGYQHTLRELGASPGLWLKTKQVSQGSSSAGSAHGVHEDGSQIP